MQAVVHGLAGWGHTVKVFALETDQDSHVEQSDVIVSVIGEEVCVAPWHNMVDCV